MHVFEPSKRTYCDSTERENCDCADCEAYETLRQKVITINRLLKEAAELAKLHDLAVGPSRNCWGALSIDQYPDHRTGWTNSSICE